MAAKLQKMAPTLDNTETSKIRVNVTTSTESVSSHPSEGNSDLDEAFKYLNSHTDIASEGINLAKLRRKIDWNIIPIMFASNTFQFLDKALINYAAVMGIKEDLKLTKNDFSNVASAFYIAYLIAEVPTGYVLQKIPAGKWLGVNVTLWGITCAATAGTFNYHSLLAARVMLGIFEAALIPCLMLLSSQYYTKSEQAPRFSIWFSGVGLGQIFGGLISFSFQHVESTHFKSWQAMFVCVGVLTILLGVTAFFIIPDSPMKANFLMTSEKAALLKHISINQTGVQNRHFKMSQIWELFFDPQIWLLNICTISIGVSAGVITIYSSTLIQGFGFSSKNTALLNMPNGIVCVISASIVGYGVRKFGQRWAWLSLVCIPGVIGASLLSFVPPSNRAASLAGIYLVGSISGIMIILYQWTMSNVAGHTKRTIAAALIAGCFSIGNIIGPQTFQARDAPGYKPAKLAVLGTQAGGGFLAIVLFGYYVWANKQKDKRQATMNLPSAMEDEKMLWENMTDKANPSFRYIY